MLPPVVAVPSSQISYQEQRPAIDATAGAYGSSAAQTVAPPATESATAAGRLNVLLLTGRERMAENLALVTDILGTAVGIARNPGESTLAYALRLADAIAALPLPERLKLEGQLAQALKGAQLRMLLASLKNTAGADAAKLSLLVELARAKERDLVARSVVTSYRQNAAEPRSDAAQQANQMKAANTSVVQRSNAVAPQAAVEGGQAVSPQATRSQPAFPTPAIQKSADAEHPAIGAGVAAKTVPGGQSRSAGAANPQPQSAQAQATTSQLAGEPVRAASAGHTIAAGAAETQAAALQAGIALEPLDVHSLQALLRRSFAEQVSEPELQNDAALEAAVTKAVLADEVADEQAFADEAAMDGDAADMDEYTPRIEMRGSETRASQAEAPRNAERPQTLLVLKGWREVQTLMPGLVDDGTEAPTRALVAQAMQAAGRTMSDKDEIEPLPRVPQEVMEEIRRRAAMPLFTDVEISDAHERGTQAARSFAETLLTQWRVLDEQMTALRLVGDMPNGMAQPLVSYLFATEMEEARKSEEERRHFDDGSSEGEAEQQANGQHAEDERDEAAAEETEIVAEDGASEQERDLTSLSADAERANDLYWRMAGWS